jgi:ABC-type antimicrobial peptide transport system permease subunit
MRIGWMGGRDFRASDAPPALDADQRPTAGVGIVNEAFVRIYFDGQNPIGRLIDVRKSKDASAPLDIVGYVRDSCYSSVREVIHPTVYLPFAGRGEAVVMVRTEADPRPLVPILRQQLRHARPDIRIGNIELQTAMVERQMLRERLLATLSFFFAAIALALAAIGLYGVLNYAVIRQRREIGIRIALGARASHVMRRMTAGVLFSVLCGTAIGVTAGIACGRFIESLLYEVKPGDAGMMAAPVLTLLAAAAMAAIPPAIRAARIDPVQTLRE